MRLIARTGPNTAVSMGPFATFAYFAMIVAGLAVLFALGAVLIAAGVIGGLIYLAARGVRWAWRRWS